MRFLKHGRDGGNVTHAAESSRNVSGKVDAKQNTRTGIADVSGCAPSRNEKRTSRTLRTGLDVTRAYPFSPRQNINENNDENTENNDKYHPNKNSRSHTRTLGVDFFFHV